MSTSQALSMDMSGLRGFAAALERACAEVVAEILVKVTADLQKKADELGSREYVVMSPHLRSRTPRSQGTTPCLVQANTPAPRVGSPRLRVGAAVRRCVTSSSACMTGGTHAFTHTGAGTPPSGDPPHDSDFRRSNKVAHDQGEWLS
jgi:hypothetical protein